MTAEARAAAALDAAVRALGGARGAVYVRDPGEPQLRLLALRGMGPGDLPAGEREPLWGQGLVGGAAERAEVLAGTEADHWTLAAPMLLGDEAVGVLAVGRGGGGPATGDAEALLARGRELARALAPAPGEVLRAELARRVPGPALAWLDPLVGAARRGDRDAVVNAFPAVSRRLGKDPLGSRSAVVRSDLDAEVPLRAWRVDDAARAALLAAFEPGAEALARELYFGGDLRERAGALRGLAIVGRGPAALDAVLDACRVTAVELFEAAIAGNPYSSSVLPAEEFRNAVLKCAFVGVSLDRVAGLETRADAELSRMLLSYVSEREVAGRSVPPDVWPVVALHPTPGLAGKLCGYLEHPAERHRAAAAGALRRVGDRRARPFLEDRLARETDPEVRRAIERAVS